METPRAQNIFVYWWGVLVAAGISALLGNYLSLGPTDIDLILSVRYALDCVSDTASYNDIVKRIEGTDRTVYPHLRDFIVDVGKTPKSASDFIEYSSVNLSDYPVARRYIPHRIRKIAVDWYKENALSELFYQSSSSGITISDPFNIRTRVTNILSVIALSIENKVLESKSVLVFGRFLLGLFILAFVLKDLFFYYHFLPKYSTIFIDRNGVKVLQLRRYSSRIIVACILIIPVIQATMLSIPLTRIRLIFWLIEISLLFYCIMDIIEKMSYVKQTSESELSCPIIASFNSWIRFDIAGLIIVGITGLILGRNANLYIWEYPIKSYIFTYIATCMISFSGVVAFFLIAFKEMKYENTAKENKRVIGIVESSKDIRVGVFGSSMLLGARVKKLAFELGCAIADEGQTLVTGGSSGVCEECCRGAASKGGKILQFLPEKKIAEETATIVSNEEAKVIYLKEGGLKERNIVTVANSDICIFIGGGWGTLNEFSIAIERDIPKFVLKNSGGISDHLGELCKRLEYVGNVYFLSSIDDIITQISKRIKQGQL